MTKHESTRIAFVCVQNAGRSQMAYAFAKREVATRNLESSVDIVTGGTRPADRVHPEVVGSMADIGIDIADRSPRAVSTAELTVSDLVITMGCSASDVCPAGWGGTTQDWDLDDPDGQAAEDVAEIRDEIDTRVRTLFEELSFEE